MVTRATSRHQYHLPGSQPPPPALSASKHRTSALGSSRLRQNVLEHTCRWLWAHNVSYVSNSQVQPTETHAARVAYMAQVSAASVGYLPHLVPHYPAVAVMTGRAMTKTHNNCEFVVTLIGFAGFQVILWRNQSLFEYSICICVYVHRHKCKFVQEYEEI